MAELNYESRVKWLEEMAITVTSYTGEAWRDERLKRVAKMLTIHRQQYLRTDRHADYGELLLGVDRLHDHKGALTVYINSSLCRSDTFDPEDSDSKRQWDRAQDVMESLWQLEYEWDVTLQLIIDD